MINDGDIAIGTVAQIVHGKGIDILLEIPCAGASCGRGRIPVFVIAGPQREREEEFGRKMLAMAQEPEFGGRVRFLGSRPDIPDVMASLDVFLYLAQSKHYRIVILQAMATLAFP